MTKYDVLIIGGGPGGYVAAIKAAQLGAKVAVIERERLGGLCLNWGCIPTKTLLITAKHYKDILRSEDFGITGIDISNVKVDWNKLISRKDDVVKKLVSGIIMLFKKNKIELIQGEAKVLDKNRVQVNEEIIECSNLVIATGSRGKYPPIPGLKKSLESGKTIVSKDVLLMKELPKSIIILGNGTYAVEYATLFNSIGVETSIVFESDHILPYVEFEMALTLERQLKKEGINIISNAKVKEILDDGILLDIKEEEKKLEGHKYMALLGIEPNLGGLEGLNLKLDSKGFIQTNEKMETNIPGVYAVGDVNGKYPLAHVAYAEGIVAAENIMKVGSKLNYDLVPTVVYSFPELASVGLTEEAAKAKGHDTITSKFPLGGNGMAIAQGETVGFVKIIADKQYGEVIGVHIIGIDAANMISKAVAIMQLEGTIYDLAKTIHPHPTFSEALAEAAFGAIDRPLHM